MTTEHVTNRLTVAGLLSLLTRAEEAITLGTELRLCLPLVAEIEGAKKLCQDVIGASHQGCAESEVILEWVADDAYNVRGTHITGLSEKRLKNIRAICAIEPSRRRDAVEFELHAEVAAMRPEDQDYWLEKAETEGWTLSELRMEIAASKREAGR